MNIYPTKKEILAVKIEYSRQELEWMEKWKKVCWNKAKELEKCRKEIHLPDHVRPKILALTVLIEVMASFSHKRVNVIYKPNIDSSCYMPEEKLIILINESIISALHELSHMLHGDSELYACAWSTHLFKKFFPMAFSKLRWEGHMLKLNKTNKKRKETKNEQKYKRRSHTGTQRQSPSVKRYGQKNPASEDDIGDITGHIKYQQRIGRKRQKYSKRGKRLIQSRLQAIQT